MSKIKQKQCWLKNTNETHPHISILPDIDNFVGRTRETQLADTLVSKQHLKFRVDFDKRCVNFELLGINASALNGQEIERNKQYTAYHGDVIEIISNSYPYKVHFENCDEQKQKQNRRESTDSSRKRKRSIESNSATMDNLDGKRIKWQIEIRADGKQPTLTHETSTWESFNNRQLYVYTTPNCKAFSKIAAFDMDGTLITTKSGKVFPTDLNDWKIAYSTVIKTLNYKHNENYKIVILTNQAGISSGKTKLPDIKTKIENIAKVLTVPIQAFVSTGDGPFRKPLTGMWQTLCDHKNYGVTIDIGKCFYVGDAAGRPENKAQKKKKDHSSVDRLLAMNLNLTFFTPEEFFLKAKTEKWIQPEFQPKSALNDTATALTEPPNSKITSNNIEVIVMVGGPGSGKSHFCREFLESNDYELISRDVLGSWQKCVNRVNDCLKAGRKVVVDNTNGDKESRMRYISAAKKNNKICRCFVMSTSFKHAEHNNAYRELIDTKHAKISKMVLNSYKKYFVEPTLDEGFAEIVRINFIPKFKNEREKSLYEMYLLSS